MSLNFDCINVKFTDDMLENEDELTNEANEVRQSIVFNMMFVGVNNLSTRIQCETFYSRYLQYALAQGTALKDVFLSYGDVRKWQGITTNVSSMTDAAFGKKIKETIQSTAWASFKTARIESAE